MSATARNAQNHKLRIAGIPLRLQLAVVLVFVTAFMLRGHLSAFISTLGMEETAEMIHAAHLSLMASTGGTLWFVAESIVGGISALIVATVAKRVLYGISVLTVVPKSFYRVKSCREVRSEGFALLFCK